MTAESKNTAKTAPVLEPAATARRKAVNFGSLENHLGYAVRRLQVWIFQDFIRKLKLIDLRPAQFSVLVVIGANPGLSQADVAESLGIERARLVHVLDLLEGRNLIERVRSVTDRRSHALHLTAEGQKFLKRAQALASEHEAELTRKLGASRHAKLLELMKGADLNEV